VSIVWARFSLVRSISATIESGSCLATVPRTGTPCTSTAPSGSAIARSLLRRRLRRRDERLLSVPACHRGRIPGRRVAATAPVSRAHPAGCWLVTDSLLALLIPELQDLVSDLTFLTGRPWNAAASSSPLIVAASRSLDTSSARSWASTFRYVLSPL